MRKIQAQATDVLKSAALVRWLQQEPAVKNISVPVQAVAPQAAYRRAQVNGNGLTPAHLLTLQRTVGNRMVQRATARRMVSADDQQQNAFITGEPEIAVQTKLIVGAPNEVYEQEADRVAGQVMTMPDAATQPPNHTGLPNGLKSGNESFSGISMDNVNAHYLSSQPAQLNAMAYAQGSDIHVAPAQQHHLPHEAWHVVQPAQGWVKPTMQMKDGVPINDNEGLEQEADVMGGRAAATVGRQKGQKAIPDTYAPRAPRVQGAAPPPLNEILENFGSHSLSSVSFIGRETGAAVADHLGVKAVATGNTIVSGASDKHTLAHEAAHVVQQRSGKVSDLQAEAHADAVANRVKAGQSADDLLDAVADATRTTPAVHRADPMKKNGVGVEIAKLSPRDVLLALDTVRRYGPEPCKAGDTDYEVGDTDALKERRDAHDFGAAEITDLEDLLTNGADSINRLRASRNISLALSEFQAIYLALAGDPRVKGLKEWVVTNSVHVDKIRNKVDDIEKDEGANQLLDHLNELRTTQRILQGMGNTDTLDVREIGISGTTQTADATVSDPVKGVTKQVEVKTVREPIRYNELGGVFVQLGAALEKFVKAGPGNWEVQVFASYSEAQAQPQPMGPRYTKTESIDRPGHAFVRTSTKQGYDQRTLVLDEILKYLNGAHKNNPTRTATIYIENPGQGGQDTLTCTHPGGAGKDWV